MDKKNKINAHRSMGKKGVIGLCVILSVAAFAIQRGGCLCTG